MAKREKIMLGYPFDEQKFNKLRKPAFLQPKLEGDRCRNESWHNKLLSSGVKLRVSVPHIAQELKYMHSYWKHLELDGELYKHGLSHEGRKNSIRSIVSRTKNLHPNYKIMEYHIFDIVSSDKQYTRLEILDDFFILNQFTFIKKVPSHPITTLDEVQYWYDYYINQGYEGIILRDNSAKYVRNKTNFLIKLKPRMSDSFTITGFKEEIDKYGNPKQTLGAICLKDDKNRKFKVGTGPTQYQRQLLWDNRHKLLGEMCKIRFQDFTKARGVPKMQSIDKKWLIAASGSLKGGDIDQD